MKLSVEGLSIGELTVKTAERMIDAVYAAVADPDDADLILRPIIHTLIDAHAFSHPEVMHLSRYQTEAYENHPNYWIAT